MIEKLYNWTISLASHPFAIGFLAVVAFLESSIFPIPPDVLLIALVLASRDKAWIMASVCTVFSVIGGLFGYIIGFFLFTSIGDPILEFYGYQDHFSRFKSFYNDWGAWIVFAGGFTPIPYKVITIASGAVHLNLITFLVASIVSRGMRFFLVSALLWYFGPSVRKIIEKNLNFFAILFFAILLLGFIVIRYVF